MNTLEVKVDKSIKNFNEFFEIAKNQFTRYERLEGIPDWGKYDFSLDCAEDQAKFKDMLQIRFIEELTEATLAMNEGPEHFFEEITDSINFFLSAYVMIGSDFDSLPPIEGFLSISDYSGEIILKNYTDRLFISFYKIIEKVGALCNLLKNRPWAQSNYLVDMLLFNERLRDLWITFWGVIGSLGISKSQLFDLFIKKVKVNEFRINSGY